MVIGALFLAVILMILAQVFLQPIRLIWKLLLNSGIGLVLLMVFNFFGGYFDFSIPVNIITVLVAGFLGVPGLILLACFRLIV